MAEAVFLDNQSGLEVGASSERRLTLACLTILLCLLPLARRQALDTQLSLELQQPRPSRRAILWGLRHQNSSQVECAIQALGHLPLCFYGETLDQLELPRGSVAAEHLPRFLVRRGDRASRRALQRLQARENPPPGPGGPR